jgi:thymidine kinase
MAKLYFKYGAMGSSKTANALITKFNYEERGMKVWLIKPSTDTRDGAAVVQSRIGLMAEAEVITPEKDIFSEFGLHSDCDVIIADECQFLTAGQIDDLRRIVDELDVPVLCFGLRTDFLTHTFPGSARLFEVADSIAEIKTICDCGSKAIVNARIDEEGRIVTKGRQVFLGGNDRYVAMCHKCWRERINAEASGAQLSMHLGVK